MMRGISKWHRFKDRVLGAFCNTHTHTHTHMYTDRQTHTYTHTYTHKTHTHTYNIHMELKSIIVWWCLILPSKPTRRDPE
jgi:hypothetical protein